MATSSLLAAFGCVSLVTRLRRSAMLLCCWRGGGGEAPDRHPPGNQAIQQARGRDLPDNAQLHRQAYTPLNTSPSPPKTQVSDGDGGALATARRRRGSSSILLDSQASKVDDTAACVNTRSSLTAVASTTTIVAGTQPHPPQTALMGPRGSPHLLTSNEGSCLRPPMIGGAEGLSPSALLQVVEASAAAESPCMLTILSVEEGHLCPVVYQNPLSMR